MSIPKRPKDVPEHFHFVNCMVVVEVPVWAAEPKNATDSAVFCVKEALKDSDMKGCKVRGL